MAPMGSARTLLHSDVNSHRQSGTQLVQLFSLVEYDFDGNALHDFHVVAGCILRRQQAEPRTGGRSDAVDVRLEIPASIRVDSHARGLTGMHVRQLSFFEIGV